MESLSSVKLTITFKIPLFMSPISKQFISLAALFYEPISKLLATGSLDRKPKAGTVQCREQQNQAL